MTSNYELACSLERTFFVGLQHNWRGKLQCTVTFEYAWATPTSVPSSQRSWSRISNLHHNVLQSLGWCRCFAWNINLEARKMSMAFILAPVPSMPKPLCAYKKVHFRYISMDSWSSQFEIEICDCPLWGVAVCSNIADWNGRAATKLIPPSILANYCRESSLAEISLQLSAMTTNPLQVCQHSH